MANKRKGAKKSPKKVFGKMTTQEMTRVDKIFKDISRKGK
jgi:hypothetical protein